MKAKLILLFLLGIFSSSFAHIGSPNVIYEGMAGKYKVLVNVLPPDVIPGIAKTSIIVESGEVQKITLFPVYWYAGEKGAPKVDEAMPSPTMPNLYEGQVWLMEQGTTSITIEIEGSLGKEKIIVPMFAVSTAKKTMNPSLGWLLVGLGALLFVLMITIIGASMSDGLVKPQAAITPQLRKRRIIGIIASGIVFCFAIWGGKTWWDSWANDYLQYMYKPFQASTKIKEIDNHLVMELKIDSSSVRGRWTSYFVPDHAKLMHLFLVRQGSMDAFAHLHPIRKDTLTFESVLPPLPAGKYLVYADIVRYPGQPHTIADTFEITEAQSTHLIRNPSQVTDKDDTYVITNPLTPEQPLLSNTEITICGSPGVKTYLQDSSTVIWEENPQLEAGKMYPLKFTVQAPQGQATQLESYLGMIGHAAVVKDDGSVYIHLHPTGNYSSMAQQILQARINTDDKKFTTKFPDSKIFKDSIDRFLLSLDTMNEASREAYFMASMNHISQDSTHQNHASVSFPYTFPQAGNYRIWIQVKRNGKILTGVFDAKVN
ncbi:MAG: hypothetical protein MUE81_00550 [Thermoflexibacter sp.]|nr:hypothetical protein [Thermoflexibacter sp.]